MRISKFTFWISFILSILTLMLSIFMTFYTKINDLLIIKFINGIMQNIFAGTIVLSITSIFEYFVNRKRTLENVMNEIIHMRHVFNQIKYFDNRPFISKDKFLDEYKDKGNESELTEIYKKQRKKYEMKQKNNFDKIINYYIEISEISCDKFWNSYVDIDLLLDFRNDKKKKIYNEFYYPIYELFKVIRECAFHFNEYKKANFGNYKVNTEILCNLQNKIFTFEEVSFNENGDTNPFTVDNDTIDVVSEGFDFIRGTSYVCGNKITKSLTKCYEEIWLLTYGKKKEEIKNK